MYIDLSELRQLPDWEIVRNHKPTSKPHNLGKRDKLRPYAGAMAHLQSTETRLRKQDVLGSLG